MSELELEHARMVKLLHKKGEDILKTLSPQRCQLIHMGMLAATEACELLDAIKAHTMYGKILDLGNIVEELGDLEFAMEGIRQILNISRGETLRRNVNKLSLRYSSGQYSDKAAHDRADKA